MEESFDLFRMRLDLMVRPGHPLEVLGTRIRWIEPVIGHLKSDHGMNRCQLKGSLGDSIHAVLCAAGYNIRWLMRMILKHGIRHFLRLIFAGMVRTNEGYFPRNLFWNPSWT